MNITQKSILDDAVNILTKFGRTDEFRVDDDWVYNKLNQIRVDLMIEQYVKTGVLDQSWMQDLGMVAFHRVNFSDDININYCECDISKATLPQFVVFDASNDLGIVLISSCGKTKFYPYPLASWKDIPKEHPRALFSYYARMNTVFYVNRLVDNMRVYGVLYDPLDAKIINSAPVTTIANGTVYKVKYGTIIYNGTIYHNNDTFTGGATTSFTGNGSVYLYSQIQEWAATDPYPVSAQMARAMVIELLVKEFGLERQQIPDVRNDSKDDAVTTT